MFIPVWLAGLTIAVLFLLAIGLCVLWQYKNHLWDCINRREQDVGILNDRLYDAWNRTFSASDAMEAAQGEIAQMKDELQALADSWSRDPSDQ